MLEIYPHLPSPFPFSSSKNGGKFEKDSYLFKFPTMFF